MGNMPAMPRALAALPLLLLGCATGPDPRLLCGTWSGETVREQWWLDGRDLRGEGRTIRDGLETVHERLALRRSPGGHVYVATPSGAAPTEFAPIDPATARFGPVPDVDAPGLVHLAWANYAHDFPQEIHYLVDGDTLMAIVSGPRQEYGWTFQRTAGCDR